MFKAIDQWLLPYLTRDRRHEARPPEHLVIAVCDHFEPFHASDKAGALARVAHWHEGLLKITRSFRDSDGVPPRHTFFYPIEQYDADVVTEISHICRDTGSEGGVHLHHADDDAGSLAKILETGRQRLIDHRLIGPDGRFPFIHGNWALDNSHPEGRHCGVSGELGVLRRNGCYADFTMPSAPSPTQTRTINSIYYATSTPRPKSHNVGIPASPETAGLRDDPEKLLIVQGPLGLNWAWRKAGILPRVENGDLTGANPPAARRLGVWLRLAPRLKSRPEVAFIKLHTHGAIESNSATLLGPAMHDFHRLLANRKTRYHYVSAREMVNIIHAFEDGGGGPPGEYRDHQFPAPRA